MTIYLSKQLLIVNYHYYYVDLLVVKHSQVTYSIFTVVF